MKLTAVFVQSSFNPLYIDFHLTFFLREKIWTEIIVCVYDSDRSGLTNTTRNNSTLFATGLFPLQKAAFSEGMLSRCKRSSNCHGRVPCRKYENQNTRS